MLGVDDKHHAESAKKRRADALPANLPPRGLSRCEAAAYIGVSPTTFDEMVRIGTMPKGARIHGRCRRWDRRKIDQAYDFLDSGDDEADDWLGATQ
jgi:predicted DNA-binding transcriptional regulator AlpA